MRKTADYLLPISKTMRAGAATFCSRIRPRRYYPVSNRKRMTIRRTAEFLLARNRQVAHSNNWIPIAASFAELKISVPHDFHGMDSNRRVPSEHPSSDFAVLSVYLA